MGDMLFGIGGVVTYKKSILPEAVALMGLEEMVLETDAPYLPPVPYRGKRNESAYLQYTCAKVAEIKGVAPEEVARQTTANARRMFMI
jgi:TatD DNase family protein